jgi:hypothetical protein
MENFVNGFTSWTETYFLIVEFIVLERDDENCDGEIKNTHESQGTGGLWELAVEWANEFEKLHQGEEWEEKDYFEEIELFCQTKNKL